MKVTVLGGEWFDVENVTLFIIVMDAELEQTNKQKRGLIPIKIQVTHKQLDSFPRLPGNYECNFEIEDSGDLAKLVLISAKPFK
jgi:hypothetical protein